MCICVYIRDGYICGKRGLLTHENSSMPELACVRTKRDLFKWQKRPTIYAKKTCLYTAIPEVCVSVKRDLLYGKRDLFIWQKRPTNLLAYLYLSLLESGECASLRKCQKRPIIWQKRPTNVLAYLSLLESGECASLRPTLLHVRSLYVSLYALLWLSLQRRYA